MKHFALTSMALVLFAFLGCGDKKENDSDNGDSSGGGPLAKRIVGTWEFEVETIKTATHEQFTIKYTYEFESDGNGMLSSGGGIPIQSARPFKWKSAGEAGNTLTIETTWKWDDTGKKTRWQATFDGNDKLKLSEEGNSADGGLDYKRAS